VCSPASLRTYLRAACGPLFRFPKPFALARFYTVSGSTDSFLFSYLGLCQRTRKPSLRSTQTPSYFYPPFFLLGEPGQTIGPSQQLLASERRFIPPPFFDPLDLTLSLSRHIRPVRRRNVVFSSFFSSSLFSNALYPHGSFLQVLCSIGYLKTPFLSFKVFFTGSFFFWAIPPLFLRDFPLTLAELAKLILRAPLMLPHIFATVLFYATSGFFFFNPTPVGRLFPSFFACMAQLTSFPFPEKANFPYLALQVHSPPLACLHSGFVLLCARLF